MVKPEVVYKTYLRGIHCTKEATEPHIRRLFALLARPQTADDIGMSESNGSTHAGITNGWPAVSAEASASGERACTKQPPTSKKSSSFTSERRIALALSVAFISLLPRAYADDWVMAFHDSRHTGQSSEVVAPPLALAWTWKDTNSYDTGNGGQFTPQPYFWLPIYYQGNVYLQGGNNADMVFCLNPANGAEIWEWANPGYARAGTFLFQFDNYPKIGRAH